MDDDFYKPFHCCLCGGIVRMAGGFGRMRIMSVKPNFVEWEIPKDFELPTCEECGEYYMTEELSDKLEEIYVQGKK